MSNAQLSNVQAIVVIDAPSNLGLKRPAPDWVPGVRKAPRVLRELGLLTALNAQDAGAIEPPDYTGELDVASSVLHGPALVDYARRLADAIGPAVDGGAFALVLGGDCSIALGSMLALRRRGRYGLLFLDGHRDLLTPITSQSAGAAGMDLALMVGVGHESITRIDGYQPLVQADDVVLFAYRDEDRWYDPALLDMARVRMHAIELEQARMQDIERVLKRKLEHMLTQDVAGFWIHLDVDVLDDGIMYAVDSREPGGLTLDELAMVLRVARSTGKAVGMHVTIYDPELDPDRRCGRGLVDALTRGLIDSPPAPHEADMEPTP